MKAIEMDMVTWRRLQLFFAAIWRVEGGLRLPRR